MAKDYERTLGVVEAIMSAKEQCPSGAARSCAERALEAIRTGGVMVPWVDLRRMMNPQSSNLWALAYANSQIYWDRETAAALEVEARERKLFPGVFK